MLDRIIRKVLNNIKFILQEVVGSIYIYNCQHLQIRRLEKLNILVFCRTS